MSGDDMNLAVRGRSVVCQSVRVRVRVSVLIRAERRTSISPAHAMSAILSATRWGKWAVNAAATPPPCVCVSRVSGRDMRGGEWEEADHGYPCDKCAIPFDVLHEEGELGGVECGVVCCLGGVRVAASV